MSIHSVNVNLSQSVTALEGWLTVSFIELVSPIRNEIRVGFQRAAYQPTSRMMAVGSEAVLDWMSVGSYVLVRYAGLKTSNGSATATFDVSHVRGPKPTRIGLLTEDEIAILQLLAAENAIRLIPLQQATGATSILNKRKLKQRLERLRGAELVRIADYHHEFNWEVSISDEGVDYLVQAGKC